MATTVRGSCLPRRSAILRTPWSAVGLSIVTREPPTVRSESVRLTIEYN